MLLQICTLHKYKQYDTIITELMLIATSDKASKSSKAHITYLSTTLMTETKNSSARPI